MTQQEFSFIDRRLKSISIRNIMTVVLCTATCVSTVAGTFYAFKIEQELMKLQIKVLEQRIERLETTI